MRRHNRHRRKAGKLLLSVFIMAGAVASVIFSFYRKNDYSRVVNSTVSLYSESGQSPQMGVEDYIAGVVISIVPAEYEMETIKAVSVVVRTYIIQQMNEKNVDRLDIDGLGVNCISMESLRQSLGDEIYSDTMEKYETAVKETKGEVITHEGNVIVPLYHMVSAGKTRNAGEIFGKDIDYLVGKESKEDVTSSEYLKIVDIDKNEFEERIGSDATITKRDSAGYVLTVTTSNGEVSGENFAGILDLNSSNFTISAIDDENIVRIVTKGKGHGLGLSIYGANELAKKGKKYDEILNYFYEDTKIE